MKNKGTIKAKSQASLEFLMTYGWAILIIIVALVIAWQMGLFNPKNIESGYSGFWGVIPEDFSYNSGGLLRLSIQNEVGATITLRKINISIDGAKYDENLNMQLSSGSRYTWSNTITTEAPAHARFEAVIMIDYEDSRTGGRTYRSTGKIWGPVEEV
jgi:hypothetical protein